MNSDEAIKKFISFSLQKRWIDRYLSLISTKKGQKKLFGDLYHIFDERLDPKKFIDNFSTKILDLPCYSYGKIGGFGKEEKSLSTAYDQYAGNGCLAIDTEAKFGIYMPEDMIDEIKFISV